MGSTLCLTFTRQNFKKARAEAKVAELSYKNTQLLFRSGNVVSKNELAMAKSKF